LSRGEWLGALRADQQRRWRGGDRVPVETYLERYPALRQDAEGLLDLIYNEVLLREEGGEPPDLDEYLRRFPEHTSALRCQFELHKALDSSVLADSGSGDETAPPPRVALDTSSSDMPPAGDSDATSLSSGPPAPPAAAAPVGWPTPSGYEILGELGRGGMGVVYKARDQKRGQTVALKTMQFMDADALFRFKHEFRAVAGVSHPNLAALYELKADQKTDRAGWFFTMEFVEGVDLLRYVRAKPERLREAVRQLAGGVAALHAAGVLHRDLKPHNVLVTAPGRVVVLDFGLAAALGPAGLHASTTQHLLGTIAYMSPEQAEGLPLSPASDWYSIGVILYQALTGRLPFAGTAPQILRDKCLREPPPPRELSGDVPDDLDALCVDLLRRPPDRRPDAAEVLRRLGGPAAGPEPVAAPRPTRPRIAGLVGREAQLRALSDAYAAVRQGHTVAVYVAGRSGVGKSSLVQQFLTGLGGGEGAVVLTGQCYEQESVPFKAFDQLIDGLTRSLGRLPDAELQAVLPRDLFSLARVFPVLRRLEGARPAARAAEVPDPQELRRRAFASLRELLGRLGDRKPLVLCIDDLQWGDADSAALLAELLRAPDPPVLLFVGCYRDEETEASPFLAAWPRAREGIGGPVVQRELAVDALSEPESLELALRLLGRADAEAHACAEVVARESGGNPFFVSELIRHVRAGAGAEGGAILRGDVSLDQAIWQRVQRLPEGPLGLLAVVAVAGRPLRQEEALRAADLGADGLSALALLRANHLVRTVGPSGEEALVAYHDRVRESVTAHLDPEALRGTHHRLALALEATGKADPELLAAHFSGAGRSAAAGLYYGLAAERAAQSLAFERAAQLYRQAIRLCPEVSRDLRSLRRHLADALANAGRGAEAAAEYQALAPGAGPDEALELRRLSAFQWLISGHIDEGLAAMRAVMSAVGLALPAPGWRSLCSLLWRRLLLRFRGLQFRQREAGQVPPKLLTRIDVCWSACVGLTMVDPIRAAAVQALNLRLALQAGEPCRLVRVLVMEGGHLATAGEASHHRVKPLLESARSLSRQTSDPHARGMVVYMQGFTEFLAGNWRSALSDFDLAAGIFRDRCTGVTWELDTARSMTLSSAYFLGEMSELRRRYFELRQESQQRGNRYLSTNIRVVAGLFCHLMDDEPEKMRAELLQVLNELPRAGSPVPHYSGLLLEAVCGLYQGKGRATLYDTAAAGTATTRSILLRVQWYRIMTLQTRACIALQAATLSGESRLPLRVAEGNAARLEREKAGWSLALASLIRAGCQSIRRNPSRAEQYLVEAVDRLQAADMQIYAAAARRRLGQLRGGAEGRALIEQADTWMKGQQIQRPDRWTAMLAPGFPDS
jgi:tRNA A-37 threonylcarbamoyl transferase component Bud32/tetratricopeptide (TPR) repeat protein